MRLLPWLALALLLTPLAGAQLPTGPSGLHLAYGPDPATTMTVMWTGPPNTAGSVEAAGPDGETVEAQAESAPLPGTERSAFWATLEGLEPATEYTYIVTHATQASQERTFRTAPAPGANATVTIAAWGDHGIDDPAVPGETDESVESIELVKGIEPDLHLVAGDVSYANGYSPTWDRYFDTFEPYLSTTPYMTVPGNHEREPGQGFTQYDRRLVMPSDPTERWYAVQVGRVLVVGLNSETACDVDPLPPSVAAGRGDDCEGAGGAGPEPEQRAWLEEALAASAEDPTIDWRVVFYHHTTYSVSSHGSIQGYQDHWAPLFEAHGVDLVVNGHDHNYQRTKPIVDGAPTDVGVTYVVAGMAGAGHYDFYSDDPDWLAYKDNQHWGVLTLEADGDRLHGRYVVHGGDVLDAFTLEDVPGQGARAVDGTAGATDDVVAATEEGEASTPAPAVLVAVALVAVVAALRRRVRA